MASSKPALSSRLANMGFMKRGTKATESQPQQQQPHAADSQPHQHSHGGSSRQQDEQQQHQQQQQQQQQHQQQEQEQEQQQQPAAGGGQKKYALSDKLTGMKFMQRGQQHKRGFTEAIGEEDAARHEAEWVVPAAAAAAAGSKGGCVVIQERDPLPAGICGRMSFGSFNPAVEQLQAEAQAAASGKPAPTQQQLQQQAQEAAGRVLSEETGVSISDADMAARGWGKDSRVFTALRMERTNKKQRRQ